MESIDYTFRIYCNSIFSVSNDYMTQKTGVIAGVVKANNGNAISGARVFFITGPVPLPDIAALTNIDGTFVLSAPVPGDYVIEVVSEGFVTKKVKISIEGNQQKHVEINLLTEQS
jgi:hypothetical protein